MDITKGGIRIDLTSRFLNKSYKALDDGNRT